jgi:hypothetical protein
MLRENEKEEIKGKEGRRGNKSEFNEWSVEE